MKHSTRRNGTALLCAALLLCVNGAACAEDPGSNSPQEFTAKIIAVLDGDTVLVRRNEGLLKIRLAEIDAPEVGHGGMGGQSPIPQKAQAYGEASKHSLSDMVLGKRVKIAGQTMDQYGRLVAHLSVDGLDVNAEQIRRGMAWEYSNFHRNKALVVLQNHARQASLGLWNQRHPTPPWKWRKLHPYEQHGKKATSDDQFDAGR